jgi:SagB-type dehydrogenase family enzyme
MSDATHTATSTVLTAALTEAHRVRPNATTATTGWSRRQGSDLWQDGGIPIPVSDIGPTSPFAETVARRRSSRCLGPPTLSQIGIVVARAGLSRLSARDLAGAAIAQRPAPSAGARHPLTLVVLASDVSGLPSGGWALDPDAAVLRPSIHAPDAVTSALAQIGDALHISHAPPAAILAVGNPDATLSRYPDGISLLWREVGALLMLVHLACTDIGLGSCIAGTCAILHPVPSDPSALVDLGAVALGATTHQDDRQ